MDLAFGSNVREHFYNIGRLSGLEADSLTRAVRSILVSTDGAQADAAQRRPFAAVQAEHMDGDIELRDLPSDAQAPPGEHPVLLHQPANGLDRLGGVVGVVDDPVPGERALHGRARGTGRGDSASCTGRSRRAADPVDAGHRVRPGPRDADDVFAILSRGSTITIRR